MRNLVPLMIILALAGCGSHTLEYRKFNGHVVKRDGINRFERINGLNTLLEIYEFSSSGWLFPVGWDGYSLFIEIPPQMIVQNSILTIPNESIKLKYWPSYHHSMEFVQDGTGTIKFIEINERYLIADLDLSVNNNNKREFKGRYKFITKRISDFIKH